MRKNKLFFITALSFLAALLVFAGCGRVGQETTGGDDAPPVVQPPPEEPPKEATTIITVTPDGIGTQDGWTQNTNKNIHTAYITSGRINSDNKVYFQYGRIEARIKIPNLSRGLWPAFWLLGQDNEYPEKGDTAETASYSEVDIMEMYGKGRSYDQRRNESSLHFWTGDFADDEPDFDSFSDSIDTAADLNNDFHIFAMDWDERCITMSVDDEVYFTKNIAVFGNGTFQRPHFMILNLAVGGDPVGLIDNQNLGQLTALNAQNNYEAKMLVDYVRILNTAGDELWRDDFNGEDLSDYWVKENDFYRYNNELQAYKPENVTVENGNLVLTAKRDSRGIDRINVTKQPDKTEYAVGETLNPAGLVVRAGYLYWPAATNITLNNSEYTIAPIDLSTAGVKTVTVNLKDFPGVQTTFDITVDS